MLRGGPGPVVKRSVWEGRDGDSGRSVGVWVPLVCVAWLCGWSSVGRVSRVHLHLRMSIKTYTDVQFLVEKGYREAWVGRRYWERSRALRIRT